jgi:hypothetical protein
MYPLGARTMIRYRSAFWAIFYTSVLLLMVAIPPTNTRALGKWLFSWFRLSEPRMPNEDRRIKEVYGLISDVVLAVIFGLVGMPVAIRWFGWFLCFVALLYLVNSLFQSLNRVPAKTRIMIGAVLCVAFWIAFNSIALEQWESEKASATHGHLDAAFDKTPPVGASTSDVYIAIGPVTKQDTHLGAIHLVGAGKTWTPAGSNFSVDRMEGHLVVNTDVHNRDGFLLVRIIDNDWQVFPDSAPEINYTSNSLEVKDKRGIVVLKLSIFNDYVQIEGEWWHEGGVGFRVVRPYPYDLEKPTFSIVAQQHPGFMQDEPRIVEMFRYPSNQHFGEYRREEPPFYSHIFLARALGF